MPSVKLIISANFQSFKNPNTALSHLAVMLLQDRLIYPHSHECQSQLSLGLSQKLSIQI